MISLTAWPPWGRRLLNIDKTSLKKSFSVVSIHWKVTGILVLPDHLFFV